MRIRTRFTVTTGIFLILLVVISASLLINNQQVAHLAVQQGVAHSVERDANELSYLSNEYLLYGESAQRASWEERYAALSDDLSRIKLDDPELLALVGDIRTDKDRLRAVFDDVAPRVTGQTGDINAIRLALSRIQVQNQSIIFDASLLSTNLAQQEAQSRERNFLLILVLVGIFGVFILVNSALIYRRTLRALAQLQADTQIIGSGNLDFSIADQGQDEIGELARAFNRMTADLKRVTASRAQLEEEIRQREQAEAQRSELLEREGAARREAEAAVRLRDEFIAIASHELKTPLTSIKGYAELLVQRGHQAGLDDRFQRMADTIYRQSQRLEKLITAMLDISRIERGQLKLEREEVSLADLIAAIVHEIQPTLRVHQLEFHPDGGPVIVQADPGRLRQVLENLIQNAVKYSPQGGPVNVNLTREQDQAHIEIDDCGIGIPKAELSGLFTQFYRGANADAFHISGLGVGLYVSREIMRLHAGDIQAASVEGKGSTFTVSLPLAPDHK